MASTVGRLVLPGDIIHLDNEEQESDSASGPRRLDLGPGLRRIAGSGCRVTEPGVYRHRAPRSHWLDSSWRRYVPVRGQCVIGVVTNRAGENLLLDIGANQMATLSLLAFEGATRTNRPAVGPGALVLARLVTAVPHCQPELTCVNSRGKADALGVLPSGDSCAVLWRVPLLVCRRLLAADCQILPALGKRLAFELAVGLNGRVWVSARNARQAVCVLQALREFWRDELVVDSTPLSKQPTAGYVMGADGDVTDFKPA